MFKGKYVKNQIKKLKKKTNISYLFILKIKVFGLLSLIPFCMKTTSKIVYQEVVHEDKIPSVVYSFSNTIKNKISYQIILTIPGRMEPV